MKKALPTSDEADPLHDSDWMLTDQGCLAVTPFTLDDTNDLHADAKDFAARICSAFPSVRAVYLRGSALESVRRDLIKDVDIIAVIDRDVPEAHAEIGLAASQLWPRREGNARFDFGIMYGDRLARQPFSTVIQLILAFRAGLLAGTPVWTESPNVRADAVLAQRVQATHRMLVHRFLDKANAAPEKYKPAFLISWMQKKALRLGGILALGVSQRFSRHPVRCAALISETYPEIGDLAAEVSSQYIIGQSDENAWRCARQLFALLSCHGDHIAKEISSIGGVIP